MHTELSSVVAWTPLKDTVLSAQHAFCSVAHGVAPDSHVSEARTEVEVQLKV